MINTGIEKPKPFVLGLKYHAIMIMIRLGNLPEKTAVTLILSWDYMKTGY